MGRKISVDSATLMNKGLEVIEARWLFDADPDSIEVVVHPQSIIHSMVSYADGSVLAQLGNPDMRTPIAHALAWPERISSGVDPLDLASVGTLDFHAPDLNRFPCLGLAFRAMRSGGSAAATLNAANEVAVQAFLDREIPFMTIPGLVESVLEAATWNPATSLEDIMSADAEARSLAREVMGQQDIQDAGHV
jgi:1-deoxy-D-xylulose-5-phosphate reductoisomerase